MADDWVAATGEELARWGAGRAAPVDVHGARLLLELAREDLEIQAAEELTPARLRELLLESFPETVVAAADEVPSVLATVRDLIGFLGDTGRLPPAEASELTAELARLEPEFAELVTEIDATERESAAEVIAGMMSADGVTLGDQEAVDDWIRRFEELSEEERYARTEDYLREAEELTVPPVRLAPPAELAAAARGSGLTTRVLALAEAARPDAADRLWWAAVGAEVLATGDDDRAIPGPALKDLQAGDDEAVLTTWLSLFDHAAVTGGDPDGPEERDAPGEHDDPALLVRGELTGVLIHLYEQDRPATRDELAAALAEHIMEIHEDCEHSLTYADVAAALEAELADLASWGVLEGAPGGQDGHLLTPLGVWGVRELLVADGFTAPVVGDLTGAPAADLVAGLVWHREDTADEEIGRWLAARTSEAAAADLVAVMRTGGPGDRNLAAAVLHRLDESAAPIVRPALGDPLIGPYAALWLHAHGDRTVPLRQPDMVWVFVDTVAGLLETAEPGAAVATALADAPPEADLDAIVEDMWRIDHPDVTGVLDALGDHHPDKKLAKAARKAAFKARSRPAAP